MLLESKCMGTVPVVCEVQTLVVSALATFIFGRNLGKLRLRLLGRERC